MADYEIIGLFFPMSGLQGKRVSESLSYVLTDVSFSLSGQDKAMVVMMTVIMTTMTMITMIMMMKMMKMILIVIERGSFFACGVDFTLDQSPRTKTSTHIVMVRIQRYEEIHKFT